MPKECPRQSQALFWPSGNRASERAQAPPPLSARRMGSSVFLLAAFRRAVRSRGPPTTKHRQAPSPQPPSRPPTADQQQFELQATSVKTCNKSATLWTSEKTRLTRHHDEMHGTTCQQPPHFDAAMRFAPDPTRPTSGVRRKTQCQKRHRSRHPTQP